MAGAPQRTIMIDISHLTTANTNSNKKESKPLRTGKENIVPQNRQRRNSRNGSKKEPMIYDLLTK